MNITISQRLTVAKHLNESFLCDTFVQTGWLKEPLLQTAYTKNHKQYLTEKGDYLTITPQLHPHLFALCQEVQHTLNYSLPIDYLLRNVAYVGAACYYSPQGQNASVVIINAGAIEHMTDDELKYLIGHELGHIINHDAELRCLYDTYCEKLQELLSVETKHKMHYYDLLCELEADRYGFLACGSEDISMRAIAKIMSGGVGCESFDLSFFLQMNHDLAEQYIKERDCIGDTHPVHPFRIEALHLYANATSDYELRKRLKPIISTIEYYAKHS